MEEQSPATLPELKVREVVVGSVQELEVAYREERRHVTAMVLKPCAVDKQIVATTAVPVTTIDPCTGQPCTTYQNVQTVRTIKGTEYHTVPETTEIVVKVPYLRPGAELLIKKLAVDATTVPMTCTRMHAVTMPNSITVPVFPLPPLPPPCH